MTHFILQGIAGTLALVAGLALPFQTQAGGVPGRLDDAVAVSVGADHSCALRKTPTGSDYAAYCWGSDEFGQLGTAEAKDSGTPVVVSTLFEDVRQIAAGRNHTCAIKDDSTLWCWGRNDGGQLGLGDKVDRETPQQVNLPANVTAAYARAGTAHTCVVASDNATPADFDLYCWGSNTFGQLGNGDQSERLTPTLADLSTSVTNLAVGGAHTCAIVGGNSMCWGAGFKGQVGNGSSALVNATPEFVDDSSGGLLSSSKVIDAGLEFSCAVVEENLPGSGPVEVTHCWGDNATQQIGRSDTSVDFNEAVSLSQVAATRIATGDGFACGYAETGVRVRLSCWGDNSSGQLGRGTVGGSARLPADVLGVPSPAINGIPFDWKSGFDEQVSLGRAHACMVIGDSDGDYNVGNVKCWGANNAGQLGDGSTTDRSEPVWVDAPPPRPVDLSFTATPSSPSIFGQTIELNLEVIGEAPTGEMIIRRGFTTVCLNVPLDSNGEASCTVENINAGAGTFFVTYSGDQNNAFAQTSLTYTVNPAPQTITFIQPPNQAFVPGATVELEATASSGLSVNFNSLSPGVCSVSGAEATLLAAGSCSIEATQGGSGNYDAAPPVQRDFEINAADAIFADRFDA